MLVKPSNHVMIKPYSIQTEVRLPSQIIILKCFNLAQRAIDGCIHAPKLLAQTVQLCRTPRLLPAQL